MLGRDSPFQRLSREGIPSMIALRKGEPTMARRPLRFSRPADSPSHENYQVRDPFGKQLSKLSVTLSRTQIQDAFQADWIRFQIPSGGQEYTKKCQNLQSLGLEKILVISDSEIFLGRGHYFDVRYSAQIQLINLLPLSILRGSSRLWEEQEMLCVPELAAG